MGGDHMPRTKKLVNTMHKPKPERDESRSGEYDP